MKICPVCNRQYGDDTSFCLEDGSPLQSGSQSAPPAQGFISTSSQPARKSSALPFVLGGGLLVILVVIGLFLALVFFAVRNNGGNNKNTAVANNNKAKPAASPQTVKPPAPSSPDYANNSNDYDNRNSASDTATNDDNSDVDFSKSVAYSGTVINETAKKSSGAKLRVVTRDDKFYLEGGLDNKKLFGRFDSVTGDKVTCPKTAPENSTCVKFDGKLAFGNGDGSNFPNGTKAPLTMYMIFTNAAANAAGAYEIGIIPGYASLGKQKGTFILTRQ